MGNRHTKRMKDATRVPASLSSKAVPTRPGRKRDHSRDPEILQAALDILAEIGYEGMTVDMVAARAKAGKATLYRRWATKNELVIDAVTCLKNPDFDPDHLPDTGTLRGDLLAMMPSSSTHDSEKVYRVTAGVASMLARNPELTDALHAAVVKPRARATAHILRRAIDRGEISSNTDVEKLSLLVPSMCAFRVLVLRQTASHAFIESLVDNVLLPAAGVRS